MGSKAQLAPDGFEILTETISIHRPHASGMRDEGSPSLIVICSWMAALPKHIQKYTDQYKKLFPASTILLIQSSWTDVAASDEKMISRLALAVSIIKAHNPIIINDDDNNNPPPPRVFLHIFSNGGATIANHLCLQLQSHSLALRNQLEKDNSHNNKNNNKPKLFYRIILECTPSRPDVTGTVKAVSFALPQTRILRIIALFLLRCYVTFGLWQCRVRGKENLVDRLRRRLNSTATATVGNTSSSSDTTTTTTTTSKPEPLWDPTVPRLYLYSQGDEIIPWRDVRDHAAEARRVGFEVVEEEVFETAPHVSLPREDFARYWAVVEGWVRGGC